MAKISAGARSNVRAAFETSGLNVGLGDRELDDLIRHIRSHINACHTEGMEAETGATVAALTPLKHLLQAITDTQEWDNDQFSSAIWDVYTGAVSGTQAAAKCPGLSSDESAWSDMITVLLAQVDETKLELVRPLWGRRPLVVLAIWLVASIAGMIGFSASFLDQFGAAVSGRSKLYAVTLSTLLFVAGDIWRRFGSDLGSIAIPRVPKTMRVKKREEDELSVSTSSSKLRSENVKLERRVQQSERHPEPPPLGTPPLPPPGGAPPGLEESPLLQSMGHLATGGAKDGPLFQSGALPRLVAGAAVQVSAEQFMVGDVVEVCNLLRHKEYNGCKGLVTAVIDNSRYHVALAKGGMLNFLAPTFITSTVLVDSDPEANIIHTMYESLGLSNDDDMEVLPEIYTPLAAVELESTMRQAKKISELLTHWHSKAAMVAAWARHFWIAVDKLKPLTPVVKALVQSHGFIGPSSVSMPRVADLKERLGELAHTGIPLRGAVATPLPRACCSAGYDDETAGEDDLDFANWRNKLPIDLKRAAPEIFRNCKAAGVATIRECVNQLFPIDKRTDPRYLELFNGATMIDFRISECKSQQAILQLLATDDGCEIIFRRIAAHVHLTRTGDRDAADAMLAVKPAGGSHDVAPTWLVAESSVYSTAEWRRRERARGQQKGTGKKGDANPKGSGKAPSPKGGKGDRKGGGKAPAAPVQG